MLQLHTLSQSRPVHLITPLLNHLADKKRNKTVTVLFLYPKRVASLAINRQNRLTNHHQSQH